jgi:ribosome maturation factor RimP
MDDTDRSDELDEPALIALLGPIVEDMGLELVEATIKGPYLQRYLRILIHRVGGATTSDCDALVRHLRACAERDHWFDGEPTIAVSTPGLDRPLRTVADFARYPGARLRLFLKHPIAGRSELAGELMTIEGSPQHQLHFLTDDGHQHRIPLADVAYGKYRLERR